MKPLPAALDDYLALRRSLGYKLCDEGRLLRQFVAFAGERVAEFITTDLALTWATRRPAEYSPSMSTLA
jgi:integrase/recombinase XerD